MSLDDKEIKKQLAKSDEEVTDKLSKGEGDIESIKRGIKSGMSKKNGENYQKDKVESDKSYDDEDLKDIGNEVDENTPNPT
jgi:hypothetical protein